VLDLLSALVEYLLGSLNRLPGEAVEPAEDSVPSSHPLTIDNYFNTGLILEYVCVWRGGLSFRGCIMKKKYEYCDK
jgi:hypothetical protein